MGPIVVLPIDIMNLTLVPNDFNHNVINRKINVDNNNRVFSVHIKIEGHDLKKNQRIPMQRRINNG